MTERLKCPDCGSANIFYNYAVKKYACLSCGYKWPREEGKKQENNHNR